MNELILCQDYSVALCSTASWSTPQSCLLCCVMFIDASMHPGVVYGWSMGRTRGYIAKAASKHCGIYRRFLYYKMAVGVWPDL